MKPKSHPELLALHYQNPDLHGLDAQKEQNHLTSIFRAIKPESAASWWNDILTDPKNALTHTRYQYLIGLEPASAV